MLLVWILQVSSNSWRQSPMSVIFSICPCRLWPGKSFGIGIDKSCWVISIHLWLWEVDVIPPKFWIWVCNTFDLLPMAICCWQIVIIVQFNFLHILWLPISFLEANMWPSCGSYALAARTQHPGLRSRAPYLSGKIFYTKILILFLLLSKV